MPLKRDAVIAFSLFILALFLISCAEEKPTAPAGTIEQASSVPEEQVPAAEVLPNETTAIPPSSPCQAGWTCMSSTHKIYRYENCSLGERQECKLGCADDQCRKPSTCVSGFKCKGQYYKGFQAEDCSWVNEVKCEWGCQDAECLPEPNETTATSSPAAVSESAPPAPKAISLKAGETGIFALNGEEHTIRIYNLEGTRVRLEVDGQRSDWVDEGKKVTFASGITIKVVEILYRSPSSSLPSEISYVVE